MEETKVHRKTGKKEKKKKKKVCNSANNCHNNKIVWKTPIFKQSFLPPSSFLLHNSTTPLCKEQSSSRALQLTLRRETYLTVRNARRTKSILAQTVNHLEHCSSTSTQLRTEYSSSKHRWETHLTVRNAANRLAAQRAEQLKQYTALQRAEQLKQYTYLQRA